MLLTSLAHLCFASAPALDRPIAGWAFDRLAGLPVVPVVVWTAGYQWEGCRTGPFSAATNPRPPYLHAASSSRMPSRTLDSHLNI